MTATEDASKYTKEDFERVLRFFVNAESVETLSRKLARRELESRLNLEEDALKSRKNEINAILDVLVNEIGNAAESSEKAEANEQPEGKDGEENGVDEPSNDSDAEEPPKAKKAKTDEPPKFLKKAQAKLMSRDHFLNTASTLKLTVGPIKAELKPRTFSSGSCGWYYGGKVSLPVGKESVWCQIGINCAVLGSKEWEDKKRKR